MIANTPSSNEALVHLRDRARGCIIGGALGDAWGNPFEGGQKPVRFKAQSSWSISDDSQLTLATCESIIETGKVSAEHIAQRFVAWYRARRITGVGSSTLKALRDLDAGNHWALAGAKGERSAGNGAAMRIAPLAFHLDPENDQDRLTIRDVSRITHHHEEAYVGALAIVTAIRLLAFARSAPADILQSVPAHLPDSHVKDRIRELGSQTGEPIEAIAAKFGSSGYVADSVPLALFATRLIETYPFDKLLITVIEAGGDTDTNASLAGQLAGACIGAAKIPSALLESLPEKAQIERTANEFSDTIFD